MGVGAGVAASRVGPCGLQRGVRTCTGVGQVGPGLVALVFQLVGAFASLLSGEAAMLR